MVTACINKSALLGFLGEDPKSADMTGGGTVVRLRIATTERWRDAGASVDYRCAPGMVHGALHAHALLPTMHSAWQAFCQALKGSL